MNRFRLLIPISFLIVSCSNPKDDYQTLLNKISEQEQTISQSYDFDFKIESSESNVKLADQFIAKNTEGEFHKLAVDLRSVWVEKTSGFRYEKEQFYSDFKNRIGEEVKADVLSKHPISNIKEMKSDKLSITKEGDKLIANCVFRTRLRGLFLNTEVFETRTEAVAEISLKSKEFKVVKIKTE